MVEEIYGPEIDEKEFGNGKGDDTPEGLADGEMDYE